MHPLMSVMKEAMAPHSSTLAWKIPRGENPGRLQSMGSLRVGHDWATSLSLFTLIHWRRKWQPTPVFLPGKIPGTAELGGLPSMGLHRVGYDWGNLAAAVHVYTEQYYSAIKMNESLPFATIHMDLEGVLLSKISQRKKILYNINYTWNLKRKTN